MPKVRVKIPFQHNGQIIEADEAMTVPDHALHALGDHVVIEDDSDQMAGESSARFRYCEIHRQVKGGVCQNYDLIIGRNFKSAEGLSRCLLWRLVRNGQSIAAMQGLIENNKKRSERGVEDAP